jgi:hypothetical protein
VVFAAQVAALVLQPVIRESIVNHSLCAKPLIIIAKPQPEIAQVP